ncbi:MAG: sugar ABC transporter permease [Chloroflexi bacterium]|nr:MAG: sugar ABC transporter permease [Chloroflexota bacterium]
MVWMKILSAKHRIILTTWCMLLPYLLGLVVLIALPSGLALGLAFTRFDALTPPDWIGITNFERLWNDRLFWVALSNTLIYLTLAVPLRIGGAFLFALIFKPQRRGVHLARAAIYLPTVIPDIAYATIWLISFNPLYGPVNLLLNRLFLPTPAWTVEPWPAMWALVIMATWQLGESFVVLLAATRTIPAELYEASEMDGAGALARYRFITLPMLIPSLVLLTARDLIVSLQANFVPSMVVTKGGPGYATLFIPLYTYWLAFDDLYFGYAAAVVWTLYGITFIVVAVQSLLLRRWHYTGSY